MTREEKIEWVKSASNEELVDQLKWAVMSISSKILSTQIRGQEDYHIISAEILRRLEG